MNHVDPSGCWFGVDDAFTGPVDEIIVVGGLSIAAYCGSQWAENKRDELWDAVQEGKRQKLHTYKNSEKDEKIT